METAALPAGRPRVAPSGRRGGGVRVRVGAGAGAVDHGTAEAQPDGLERRVALAQELDGILHPLELLLVACAEHAAAVDQREQLVPGVVQEFEDVWSTRAPIGWDLSDAEPPARACVALLSDWFPRTTGEIVHVDGGVHAMGA